MKTRRLRPADAIEKRQKRLPAFSAFGHIWLDMLGRHKEPDSLAGGRLFA